MKIFKSIKWRLQLWYGLILLFLLAGFGLTAYQLDRGRQFRRIDDELHHRIGILGAAMHRPPPMRRQMMDGDDGPPDRPSRGQGPEEDPLDRGPRPGMHFQLPPENAHFFDTTDPNNFYFSVYGRDGHVVAHSTNQPAELIEQDKTLVPEGGNPPRGNPPRTLAVEDWRIVSDTLPSGETILVGCTVAPELKELRHTAVNLFAVGGLVMLIGLTGGAWLVSRSLRPLEVISATAVKISAGDLTQRINAAETESELGQLAAVLNSTFARLETAFAQQKQFASDAAHELRTPVSVILTQTQTALQRERDAASYKQTVEACQRAALRMKKLIESLLALARFDAGQEVLKQLRFDLAKTARDCADMVQPLADERGVKITVEAEPLEISGDPERLAQVITNLLTNAIQYNHSQGEVQLLLSLESGLAVLRVKDTGQGITPEDLPRVFGRFYRADKSRTGGGNAGLGLAISKAIVEAHAGTIEVASEGGSGTTFTIRLPIGSI